MPNVYIMYIHTCNQYYCTVVYISIIYKAIFCYGASLKKTIWARGDSNLRRRSQSTDMLCCRPSCIPEKYASSPELSNTVFSHHFLGVHDGLEHSMSVDWDQRRRFESPRGQMFFFNDVPWQNIAICIINIYTHSYNYIYIYIYICSLHCKDTQIGQ